jgi:hypothetical protein
VVHRRLLQVPSDVDLWDSLDEILRSATEFWDSLRALPGVDWVIAGKLGARKRPRLIPVLDSVTLPMLGALPAAFGQRYERRLLARTGASGSRG